MQSTEQRSLFEESPEEEKVIPIKKEENSINETINVTQMSYIDTFPTTWKDVFKGYDEIRVITFSYSLNFIKKVTKDYKKVEIILGYDRLINKEVTDIFAFQEYSNNRVLKDSYFRRRIADEEMTFYVLKDIISHQKIYLLKADDGRVRTIFGSANISRRAWEGYQVEDYAFCDDERCYEHYMNEFDTLREFSTNKISIDAKEVITDENADITIPIMKEIEKKNAVVINQIADEEHEARRVYEFDTKGMANEWKQAIQASKVKFVQDKNGIIKFDLVTSKKVAFEKKKLNDAQQIELKKNPQFVINYDEKTVRFNENKLDLSPKKEEIANDVQCVIEYMNGFDIFIGDTVKLKSSYWRVLNYMFLSPFLAKIRYEYSKLKVAVTEMRYYPIYMLLCGDSDSGKTAFVETVQKLMYGEKLNKLTAASFSREEMNNLKANIKGCNILIDELTGTKWKYAKDIVKTDDYLLSPQYSNHPAFVLTSNDVKKISPDISKRMIYMIFSGRITREDVAKSSMKVSNIRAKMTTALYREYLRRMLDKMDEIISRIERTDEMSDEPFIDMFDVSSSILQDIFNDCGINTPEEFKIFSWDDYMGSQIIGAQAIEEIRYEFEYNRQKMFYVNKRGELEIDFSLYPNDADSKIKKYIDELPPELKAKRSGNLLILDNAVARKMIGINTKRKLFSAR